MPACASARHWFARVSDKLIATVAGEKTAHQRKMRWWEFIRLIKCHLTCVRFVQSLVTYHFHGKSPQMNSAPAESKSYSLGFNFGAYAFRRPKTVQFFRLPKWKVKIFLWVTMATRDFHTDKAHDNGKVFRQLPTTCTIRGIARWILISGVAAVVVVAREGTSIG